MLRHVAARGDWFVLGDLLAAFESPADLSLLLGHVVGAWSGANSEWAVWSMVQVKERGTARLILSAIRSGSASVGTEIHLPK